MMNRISRDIFTVLSEQFVIQENATLVIKKEILLLSSGLRSDQIDVLKSTLNSLKEEHKLVSHWKIKGDEFTIKTSKSFPSVDACEVERDLLIDQWVRRTLLFKLYDIYRESGQRLTRFPLMQLAEPLGINSEDLKRHVFYLEGEYLLEYRVADGGNCTCNIMQDGIRLCEDRSELFQRFGTLQISDNSGYKSSRVRHDELYVAEERIEQLRALKSSKWDFSKLTDLCEELNIATQHECYLAIAMILRAIMDHVPPVFGFTTFDQVVANYRGGSSFKQLIERLNQSIRSVADMHIHRQIRKKETLPTFQQVNCITELDALLAEILDIVS